MPPGTTERVITTIGTLPNVLRAVGLIVHCMSEDSSYPDYLKSTQTRDPVFPSVSAKWVVSGQTPLCFEAHVHNPQKSGAQVGMQGFAFVFVALFAWACPLLPGKGDVHIGSSVAYSTRSVSQPEKAATHHTADASTTARQRLPM